MVNRPGTEQDPGSGVVVPIEWQALHRTHRARFLRIAHAALRDDPAEAVAVVDEVFLIALRKWETILRSSNHVALLIKILLDEVATRTRRLARRPPLLPLPEDDVAQGHLLVEPAVPTDQVNTRQDLYAALRALPSRQREVTVLFYLCGEQLDTVAQYLGITEGTARIHLARGIAKLRNTHLLDSYRPAVPPLERPEVP